MSAQLEQAHRPGIAAQPRPSPTPPLQSAPPPRPAQAVEAEPASDPSRVDRDAGLGLLSRFLIATSVMVAVVMLVEAVGHDWILVPAMAIHLALTYVVLHGIFLLVGDGYESDAPGAR